MEIAFRSKLKKCRYVKMSVKIMKKIERGTEWAPVNRDLVYIIRKRK